MDQLIAMFLADPSAGELLLGTGSTGMAAVLFTGRINGRKFFQTPIGMFKIEEALRRSAELEARRISVEFDGSTVRLYGSVRSWAERERRPSGPRGPRLEPRRSKTTSR